MTGAWRWDTLAYSLARVADHLMRTRPGPTWEPGLHLVRDALPTPDAAAGGATPTRPVRRGSPRGLS